MKALCLVAHPDDCVIFAYSYMFNHPEHEWTVGYLTYQSNEPRAAEFAKFWNKRNIDTVFLGFEDHWHDNEQKKLTRWYGLDAAAECQLLARDYDIVLTHDEHGDYGHIHHKLVHSAVATLNTKQVYFASTFNYNKRYMALGDLPMDQFPLHRDVIEQMTDINCGLYIE